MIFSKLQEHDSTLQLCSCSLSSDFEFKILSIFEKPISGAIYFLKDRKFFNSKKQVIESNDYENALLITHQKFFEGLEQEQKDLLSNKFQAIAFTENVDLSISYLSKPFYERLHGLRNELVDGRQMGTAQVHPTANIAQNVFIGENVVIGESVTILTGSVVMSGASIGANTYLYPNVTIYPDVVVGERCRIHSQTVIGSDGYGYNYHEGVHHKVWHLGSVIIENDIELGAGCCVDRGALGDTVIGAGSKLDNIVHIAHNCQIGKGVILCGMAGVAGSATIGDYTVVGGGAAIAPGINIGPGCQIGGKAGVTSSLPAKSVVSGYPARPVKEWLKGEAALRKLALGDKKR